MCEETVQLVDDMTSPWSPSTNGLYPPAFRSAVRSVVLTAGRLGRVGISVLPMELWLHVISCLRRDDFGSEHCLQGRFR